MEKNEERDYIEIVWRFLSSDESDEYMDDSENKSLVSLRTVLSIDNSFIELLKSEVGTSFERNQNGIFEEIKK